LKGLIHGDWSGFFHNIKRVGITHDYRRDDTAKQCLAVKETQTAVKEVRGGAIPEEMNLNIFLYDLQHQKV
jgi:hypothetical protein